MDQSNLPSDYPQLLANLKKHIQQSRIRASLAVNHELILLYWRIGRTILERQARAGWGAKIVNQLSHDLRIEFPEMKGLSRSNLLYMRRLAESYPDEAIVPQVVGQIPWGHNREILDKISTLKERLWYAKKVIEHGWSRNVLVHQIEAGLFERQGKASTNFEATLPAANSDLAHQLLKDPYALEFLGMAEDVEERKLEKALVGRIREFLLELGVGFAFVGNQYHLEVDGSDFYIDLLFYHLKLRSYFVIELKRGDFRPEYAGKMNFYLSAVDDLLRHPDDGPTIGLILCKNRSSVIAEYSLRDAKKPIGITGYRLEKDQSEIPKEMQQLLPSAETLEAEIGKIDDPNNEDDSNNQNRSKD